MAANGASAKPENPQDSTKDDVRSKALKRLAAAGMITVAALAGLWWLDQSSQDVPEKKPPPPSPILTAPAPIITVPETPPVEEMPSETPAEQEQPPSEPAQVSPSAPPPPPRAALPARVTAPSAGETRISTPETRPSASFSAREEPRPARTAAAAPSVNPRLPEKPILAEAAPPAGRGYVVQLGVFTNPKNAQELVQRLQALGIRAYTETRVHVGPFLSEDEAEKARLALLRHNIKGVVGATK